MAILSFIFYAIAAVLFVAAGGGESFADQPPLDLAFFGLASVAIGLMLASIPFGTFRR